MESLVTNKAWDTGEPLENPRLRLPNPPRPQHHSTTGSRRTGRAVEDLGSSFAPQNSKQNKVKSGSMEPRRPPETTSYKMDPFTLDSDTDSGPADELDTLSQDTTDDPIHYGTKVKKDNGGPGNESGSRVGQAEGIGQTFVAGERLPTDAVIKKLKFKKNKPATDNSEPGSQRSDASSSKLSVLELGDSGHTPARDIPRKPGEGSLSRTPSLPSQPSRPRKRFPSPAAVRRALPSRPKDACGNSENTRPKPRPIGKSKAVGSGKKLSPPSPKETATSITIKKPYANRALLMNSFSPSQLPDNTPKRPMASLDPRAKEGKIPLPRKKELPDKAKASEEFPMLWPLSSQVTGSGEESGTKTRTRKAPQRVILSEDDDSDEVGTVPAPLKPQPFPMSTQDFANLGSSSMVVPSGQEKKRKGKGTNGTKAQPFPMSTGVLESIGSSPTTSSGSGFNRADVRPFPMSSQDLFGDGLPPSAGPSSSKPFAGSDNQQGGKKRKDPDAEAEIFDDYSYEEDEDAIMISPSTDPRTLCPYCDAPLPPSPTPRLKRLLAATEKKSHREARPANPLGRKAPFSVFMSVCQRHRFESQILPEAELKGWPKSIDWSELGTRVRKMKDTLQSLIDDSGELGDREDEWIFGTRPRMNCVFWKEIMAEVKQKGSRAVTGVRGQFATFEKGQPGYYGELGSVIIHQTLYDLFPPASTNATAVAPLTANEFIQRVLVPEVGLRLIMEDQELDDDTAGMEAALKVLRESASYGVAMFPADEHEEGEEGARNAVGDRDIGVADQMMMERARKRRKELEKEETNVESEFGDGEPEVLDLKRCKVAKKGKSKKGKAKPPEPVADAPLAPARPRPRPIGRIASTTSLFSDVEKKGGGLVETDVEIEPASSQRSRGGKLLQSPVQLGAVKLSPRRSQRQTTRPPFDVGIDLCSSSDGVRANSGSGSRKRRNKRKAASELMDLVERPDELGKMDHSVSSLKTPKPARTRASTKDCEVVDVDDTPRPLKRRSHSSSTSPEAKVLNSHPLMKARARKPREDAALSSSLSFKDTASSSRDREHSWLLSDTSHSSLESIRN